MTLDSTLQAFEQGFYSCYGKSIYYGYTNLVLGAFGCGAFCNVPEVVAEAFERALTTVPHRFEEICFAILRENDTTNYAVFKKAFDE